MRYMLTTVAATRVAGLDRQRLNEYISMGDYPCAPATTPGKARLFDPDDVLGLIVFKRLMEEGYSPSAAGKIACKVAEGSRQYPDASRVYVRRGVLGSIRVYSDDVQDPMALHADGLTTEKVTMFNLEHYRQFVAEGTQEQMAIVGPQDPE